MQTIPNPLNEEVVIAADIGGSHITVAPVNLSSAEIVHEKPFRTRVNSKASKDEILNTWLNALETVFCSLPQRPTKLALAMPGPFDYEKGIAYIQGLDKYESLYGANIKDELVTILNIPSSHVLFRNDAEAFLHGEVATGLVDISERVLGLTLGTGMGAAFSHEGKTADLNLGSEPYQTSIADDFFTTRWFIKRYNELSGTTVDGVETLTRMAGNNKIADLIFEEYAYCLTSFLAPYIKREKVDTLVFGGNISKAHQLFLPQLSAMLAAQEIVPKVKLALQGEQSAIIGAAFLFKDLEPVKHK
ncbi:ROK family protein [Olivibacter domesticus]|uniref:Glucokinase n=1 Tax=Olivibacter domesticus TaxID=407022 RepID=A0A1H7WD14_OLID1|nr:ROK family protein [Olivibacter domesticus]SEM18955.1 glucokinase [Olivibacter domesticus]